MKKHTLLPVLLLAVALPVAAQQTGRMPMQGMMDPQHMKDRQGGMMHGGGTGMMSPEMMQQKQAMMQKHMTTMEQRLASIESLLRELVQLQKRK